MSIYLMFLIIAFIATSLLVALLKLLGRNYPIATPQLTAKEQPAPLGGIAIYFGFITALLVLLCLDLKEREFRLVMEQRQLLALSIGAAMVSMIGLIHDIFPLSPLIRTSVYLLAALLLVVGGIGSDLAWLKIGTLPWPGDPLFLGTGIFTIIWTVCLIWCFTLLDRGDGIVAGITMIAAVFLFVLANLQHDHLVALFGLILAGTMTGMFWHQIPPATIRSGSMGSGFVGFMLAVLTLRCANTLQQPLRTAYPQSCTAGLAMCQPFLLVLIPTIAILLILRTQRRLTARNHTAVAIAKPLAGQILSLSLGLTIGCGAATLLICQVSSQQLALCALLAEFVITFIIVRARIHSLGQERN